MPTGDELLERPLQIMKSLLITLLVTISFISGNSFAGGWQQASTVKEYVIEGSFAGERIYVKFDSNFSPDSCNNNDTEWKRIYGSTPQGKYLFTTIMSAKATGQTVVPYIEGCDDWGRAVIRGIWVQ